MDIIASSHNVALNLQELKSFVIVYIYDKECSHNGVALP